MEQLSTLTRLSSQDIDALMRFLEDEGLESPELQTIPQRANRNEYPLSFAQTRLWFLDQLEPGNTSYNVSVGIRLQGPLNRGALQQSLDAIVRRHETLRASFVTRQGQPVQTIAPAQPVPLTHIDLGSLPSDAREQEAHRRMQITEQQPFDLAHGPLLRATLLRLGDQEHLLGLVFHHIIFDGWSEDVLYKELALFYSAYAAGETPKAAELPIQYADYARWQQEWMQGSVSEQLLAYWTQQLAGAPALLELPTDRPRPATQTFHGATQYFKLPRPITDALAALGQQEGCTLFMTLLAAFQVLLSRYTRQSDIAVGSPIANRTRAETEGLIGLFINTLVLRSDLSGSPNFRQMLRRVREVTLDAYTHQDLPFEQLVESLKLERNLSYTPLFQAMFVLQDAPAIPPSAAGLMMRPFEIENRVAKFDILMELVQTDQGIRGELQYNTDLFEDATITRMAQHFLQLLESIVAQPDRNVETLPLLTAAEQQLMTQWNATDRIYPESHCLHTLIEAQVKRTPDAVAVMFEHEQLTYAELDRRANQLAHHLKALGVGSETLVGICVERSLELVVGLLGILKAGGAYVPFDPSYPQERLAFMLADAQVTVLLTQRDLLERIRTDAHVVCLDTDWTAIAREPDNAPASFTLPENSAYAIYTSGSTGKPKGAVNTHRGICNRLLWMQEAYRLTESDRVLQKTPFSFDVSVWEFFWPLITGAALVVARPNGHRDSAYLAGLIAERQITTLHFVPSMLQIFLDEDLSACRSVRRIICSGEALSPQLQQSCLQRLDAELHNLYGPTEAAIDVTFWECRQEDDQRSVPIGRPIANTQIHLLDPHLRPVPVGVAGELCIGGVGLARGYLNRPELTAEKFIPDPIGDQAGARLYRTGDLARHRPDGTIEFLGRIDHQVKIRGFRIELGEIEAALTRHPAVREAVATTRTDGPYTLLTAYIVPTGGQTPLVTELRNFLQTTLPDYMVPATFVFLDALPLTPTGKLDRRALPAPEQMRPDLEEAYVAPRTIVEELLANIWAEALKIPCVGIRDNFFALGGDSIRSVGVLALARERGIQLSLQDIFRYQTIADLSEHLQAAGAHVEIIPRTAPFALISEADRQKLPAQIEDAYPLTSLQMGMLYHMELTPDAPDYHNLMSNYFGCPYDFDLFCQAVQQIVARHPALRTSIDFSNYSEPLQLVHRVDAIGPAEIGEDDIRHLPQSQQEQVIVAFIESESRRPLDISQAPLLRFHLHRRADDAFQITFTEFHPILDGWSSKYLMSEVFEIYLSLLDGLPAPSRPALESTFRDYVCLERMALHSEVAQRYWVEKLQDVAILRLPRWPEAYRDQTGQRVRRVTAPISAELSADVQRLAATAGVPVKTILLTAHLRVMSLLSGQTDVMTGMVSHGRLEERDGDQVYGLFLNSLPFRLRLTEGSWLDFVKRTFEAECEAIPFRRYPVATIQQQIGSREPLFEVLFNYTNFHPVADLHRSGRVEDLGFTEWSEPSSVPLQVGFFSDPVSSQVGLRIEYHTSVLCAEQVQAIAQYYVRILTAMVQDPAAPYERVAMLSEAETQRILVEFNTTAADYATDQCMHHLFEAQAARTPGAVAVVCEGASLTYGELNRQANQLAHHLKRLGVGRGTLVAVYMERCLEMIPALLGILKAGAAYVPIERKWPANRTQWIIMSLNIEHIITRQTHLQALEAIQPSPLRHVICLQSQTPPARTVDPQSAAPAGLTLWTQARLSELRSDNLPPQAGSDDLAYIIFTSGSTGTPKGVMVRHKPVINLIEWVNRTFGINPADRVLFVTALSFDLSVYDVFGLLAAGGSIQVVPDHDLSDPARLLSLLCDEPVTFWDSAPAAFQQLVPFFPTVGSRGSASRLRLVFFSGDWIPVTLPDQLRGVFPRAQVISLGGATEATVWSNYYPIGAVDPRWISIPYGKPIQNARYHVLDRHLNPCPIGTPGDLYIGGECLAAGYVNEPLLTSQKFIPDPFGDEGRRTKDEIGAERNAALHNSQFSILNSSRLYRTGDLARYWPDGNIEFLGRNDHQVKIRGFRIELGEIEAVLSQHPAVRESVVVAREDVPGEKRLVAYVVPKPGPDARAGQAAAPGAGELRQFLQAALPDYMVPSAYVFLDALPLSSTKKVDRSALPAPDQSRPDLVELYVAPRTPAEQELAELWAKVLRIERVGAEDDFFALGGNSLLATQVVTRVRDQFQIDFTLRSFFERPTVAALAEQIERAQWADVSLELAGVALQGEREEGVL